MKILLLLTLLSLTGCLGVTEFELKGAEDVCKANGGVYYILPRANYSEVTCKNGAKFDVSTNREKNYETN